MVALLNRIVHLPVISIYQFWPPAKIFTISNDYRSLLLIITSENNIIKADCRKSLIGNASENMNCHFRASSQQKTAHHFYSFHCFSKYYLRLFTWFSFYCLKFKQADYFEYSLQRKTLQNNFFNGGNGDRYMSAAELHTPKIIRTPKNT